MNDRYEAQKMIALWADRVKRATEALDRAWDSGDVDLYMRVENRLDEAQERLASWQVHLANM